MKNSTKTPSSSYAPTGLAFNTSNTTEKDQLYTHAQNYFLENLETLKGES